MIIFAVFLAATLIILISNLVIGAQERRVITRIEMDKDMSFSELLPYANLVDDGTIQTTAGTLISGFFYKGQDISTALDHELESRRSVLNYAIKDLGENFVLHIDAIRTPSTDYPSADERFFTDAISEQIDQNRRKMFQAGDHYETTYVIIITYVPPMPIKNRLNDLLYTESEQPTPITPLDKNLEFFKRKLDAFKINLEQLLDIHPMHSYFRKDPYSEQPMLTDEMINYINYTLTGKYIEIQIPQTSFKISELLAIENFEPGTVPVIGSKSIACITVCGYPAGSLPTILTHMDKLPYSYRLSHRYIMLEQQEAIGIAKAQQRKWRGNVRGFRDQYAGTEKGVVNLDAEAMVAEASFAFSEISEGSVAYGLHTCTIVCMDDDRERLFKQATEIKRQLAHAGFASYVEDVNCIEAFLGSFPGNITQNLRQAAISTMVLSDLLPTSAIWVGDKYCPHPDFPPETPALIHASTEGVTPFRFNLHVGDVGHSLIFGPTGAGKSTLIALILVQFRAYRNAKIYAFDKGYSLYVLAKAINGDHYDLAGKSQHLQFSPLREIDTNFDLEWAADWLSTLVALQENRQVSPGELTEIKSTLKLLQKNERNQRTLTDFINLLQNDTLRLIFGQYTDGLLGEMLDNDDDNISLSDFCVFELEHLMNMADKNMLPILLYVFHKIENSLTGDPTIISLDEGWIALGNEVFREKLKEWLKVLRKRNCSVIFSTQSISDAGGSGILDVLSESCLTHILLPNESAKDPSSMHYYEQLGLNEIELELISVAKRKKDYYIKQKGRGKRLLDFGLDSFSLSYLGQSGEAVKEKLDQFIKENGERWQKKWAAEHNI